MPTARDTATLLLQTLPLSMRLLGGVIHHRRPADDPPLNMGQLRMLEMLRRQPWTLSDLAERHHVATSTMSRTIDVLARRLWVERCAHPGDRRLVVVRLTDAGEAAHAEMHQRAEETLTRLVEQLPEEERERLYGGLQVLQRLAAQVAEHGLGRCEEQRPAEEESE